MHIYFGLELDDLVYPKPKQTQGAVHYFGPQGLLLMLESHLGLIGHPNDNQYLRIEQFRQALIKHLDQYPKAFYRASFEADQLATATTLLSQRDELLLAGWDFDINKETPRRLQTIAEINDILSPKKEKEPKQVSLFGEMTTLSLAPGFADRFMEVLEKLTIRQHPIKTISLNEPMNIIPVHLKSLFDFLAKNGVTIQALPTPTPTKDTDLALFQKALLSADGKKEKQSFKNDGSLLILNAKRETDAANYLAKLFQQNNEFRPLCLIPEKNRALDNAFIQEGLPSLGILSASLARPSLQILKLVTGFFWRPIDPFKIMEFVSLSVKPLADDLATLIANQIARTPGLKGEGWYIMINRYFEELKERAKVDKDLNYNDIRKQYEFWFERDRYDASKAVPKSEVIEVFDYLANWAYKLFEDTGAKNKSLSVLSGQAKRVKELLEALPESETQLSNLELERIVRTIYEPSPILFKERELEHLQYVHQSSAIIAPVQDLIWWNFIRNERDHFFSRWYKNELDYLDSLNVPLQRPTDENTRLLWQRPRPVLYTQNRLVLVIPKMVDGTAVNPHALHDVLEASFDNPAHISFDIDNHIDCQSFERYFQLPQFVSVDQKQLGKVQPFIYINSPEKLQQNEQETFSSLDTLFYYPYQWVFRHKIKLRKSAILSVVKDVTLMGNLSHRFFEEMFKEDIKKWDKEHTEKWIDTRANRLLAREGAVLLMYGREPDRVAFINRVKYAAWSLISMIQSNGWKVEATEMDLAGKFKNIPIKAKADLVLKKKDELVVVDLKWRGASRRQRMIKNEEDLQLVMYSKLLTADETWAHTAYFILENGKMIARNNLAFNESLAVTPDSDHIDINERIWSKMGKTYQWRMDQLRKGQIEIRTDSTLHDFEEVYQEELMEVLEMKKGDSPFDDYRTLINLIE